jgi:hypothetical protein
LAAWRQKEFEENEAGRKGATASDPPMITSLLETYRAASRNVKSILQLSAR